MDLSSIVTPPSVNVSLPDPDTPDTGYPSSCVSNSEISGDQTNGRQCVAEAQQQCACDHASVRHVSNDKISVNTQSLGCAKCTKRHSDDNNLNRSSNSIAATKRFTKTMDTSLTGQSPIHQAISDNNEQQRIYAGSSPKRSSNVTQRNRSLSTDSDCLSITMSE